MNKNKYIKSTVSILCNEEAQTQARDYYIRFVQSKFVTQKDDFDKDGTIYRALPRLVREILKFKAKQGLVEFDIPQYWNDDIEGEVS